MGDLLKWDVVGIVSSIVAAVVWFVRLEGRIKSTEREIHLIETEVDALIIKHDALDSKILQEISMIRESIVRLETIFNMLEHGNNGNVNKKKERS